MAAGSIESLVHEYIEAHGPACIDEAELERLMRFLRSRLDPGRKLSQAYLLRVLSDAGVEIARSLGGLPVDLRGAGAFSRRRSGGFVVCSILAGENSLARENGDRLRQQDCRRAVRQAKDRLKMHLRRRELSKEQRAEKQELLEWFLVWLETPELFPQWLELRRTASTRGAPGPKG